MNTHLFSRMLQRTGFGLAILLSSAYLQAQPLLNGLAVSTELGKERFIAALYTDSLSSDANEVLNSTSRRSMELKVTADRLSARSVNSMWIEGMAINNSGAVLKEQANNVAKLTNMVRKRLVAGDVLRFDSEVGKGTTVTLNGVTLGNIPNDNFFNILLRTWIGSVPLSSEFRDGLLASGRPDSALESRYRALQPQDGRAEAVASWNEPKEEAPETTTVATAVRPEPPKPTVSAQKPAIDVAAAKPTLGELAKPTIAAIQSDESKKAAAAATVATEKPVSPKSATTDTTVATTQQPKANNTAKADKPATSTVALVDTKPKSVTDDDDDEEEAVITAESILSRQLYVSELMSKSRKNLEYPRRAVERRQEGSVRISVIINRDGSVKNSMLIEESDHRLLNREVMAMIERASPFPPMPKELSGDQFEFTVPISFELQEGN